MAVTTKRATIYFDPLIHKALRFKSVETSRSISDCLFHSRSGSHRLDCQNRPSPRYLSLIDLLWPDTLPLVAGTFILHPISMSSGQFILS